MSADDAPALLHAAPCLALAARALRAFSLKFGVGGGEVISERRNERI